MESPSKDSEAWREHAKCRFVNLPQPKKTELFYPEVGQVAAAPKAICRNCPVTKECLAAGIKYSRGFGVWGGLSARDRRGM